MNIIKIAKIILSSKPNNIKHISFITNKNNVICYGINHPFKTDPLSKKYNYRFSCIHSEVAAIKLFPYPVSELKFYTMINVRILANGQASMAKPCIICQKLLMDFGIKKVYYTDYNGELVRLDVSSKHS